MRRKALSITQRLTLTSIVLTGAVLVPAVLLVELAARRSVQAEAAAFALHTAERTHDTVLAQWDEEFLVEFGAESVTFRDLRAGWPDWALSRPDGTVERTNGIFAAGLRWDIGEASQVRHGPGGAPVRLAHLPVVAPVSIPFEDLPETVRDKLQPLGPSERCVSVRREMAAGGFAFEVKMLGDDSIQAVKVAPDGTVVRQSREALPRSLPRDLLELLEARGDRVSPAPIEWCRHRGQLLAVVTLARSGEEASRWAINRVAERYRLGPGTGEITPDESSRLYLTVAVEAATELRTLESLQRRLWLGGGLVWGLLSLVGWFVARRAMRPVQRIVDTAAAIDVERLAARLPVGDAEDELARIAATLNDMLDRLQTGYDRERALSSDIAHELRTPLAKIVGEIDLSLSRARGAEGYVDTLVRCRGYAVGLERLVEALLLLARLEGGSDRLQAQAVDLGSLAAETISLLPAADRERVTLTMQDTPGPILSRGEPNLLRTMLRNLLENAARHGPPGTPIQVVVGAEEASNVTMEVVDAGPGIPAAARERVFDRFFRLDSSRSRTGGGLGLGLSIVRAIVHAHRGAVKLDAAPSGGTVARVTLPASCGSEGLQRSEN